MLRLGGILPSLALKYVSTVPLKNLCGFIRFSSSKKFNWQLGKLNHVALVVPDLKKASVFYRDVLGATVSDPQSQPEHGVYTVFVELGDTKIELLHPIDNKSPVSKFLETRKHGGMHHVCLEVSDIEEAVKTVKEAGVRTMSDKPKVGAHGKPVMFLHPKDCCGVLVELEEA